MVTIEVVVAAEVAEDVGVEDKVVEEEGVEETGIVQEVVKDQEIVRVKDKEEVRVKVQGPPMTGTRPLAMLTNLLSRPVSGTGPSGSQLIFVWSQGLARGRTSGCPKPTNRKLTSSITLRISS